MKCKGVVLLVAVHLVKVQGWRDWMPSMDPLLQALSPASLQQVSSKW